MAAASPDLDDWLAACRRAAAGLREVLGDHPTTAERLVETGRVGGGGDRTLVIDHLAELRVFDELQRFHDAGARFTVVSEERGHVDFGGGELLVVVDPLDGSLNAKRGLPQHALSIALADGPTMSDVLFGFVCDLGTGEEWHARRGQGAYLDGARLDPPPERRGPDGRIELLAIESTDPRWIARRALALEATAHRLRAFGVMAVTICQVAATRVDGAVSLARTRAVDVAAAQLIVRESGGLVEFVGCPGGPLAAPLDLAPRHPIVAARTAAAIAGLEGLPLSAEERGA